MTPKRSAEPQASKRDVNEPFDLQPSEREEIEPLLPALTKVKKLLAKTSPPF